VSVRGHIRACIAAAKGEQLLQTYGNCCKLKLVASGMHASFESTTAAPSSSACVFAPVGPLSVSFEKCFISVAFLSAGVRSPEN